MATDDGAPEQDGFYFRDPAEAKGYTAAPNWLWRFRGPSIQARFLFALLLSYAWQEGHCWPGQRRLAEDLEVSERTIRTWLKELVDARLISIERRGLNRTNVYWIEPLHQAGAEVRFRSVRKSASAQKRQLTAGPHEKKTQLRTPKDEPRPLKESYDRFVQS